MRTLVQPGPVHPSRIDSFAGEARRLRFTAEAGLSLLDALTGPLVDAGFQAATFGWDRGQPFLHCHAAWIEPDGQRRGGHILNDATILKATVAVEAWGFTDLRIATALDAETNFTLLQPSGESVPGTNAVLARVRPNQDITAAVETIAHAHGMPDAVVAGSVGSLVGTRFDDSREVPDHATEVLVTSGAVRDGVASLNLISVDMAGHVHEGRLARGENPVCITFDLVLIRETR